MPRFFLRLAEGIFDQQDLRIQTDALVRFIQAASRAHRLRDDRVVAVGYSNGANIASSVLLTHPKTLAAAVLFRPMVPFIPTTTPHLREKKVFVGAGKRDPIASQRQTRQLVEIFEGGGAAVTTFWHDGGHELGQDDLDAAHGWVSAWRAMS